MQSNDKVKILIIDDDPLTNKFNELIIRKLHPEVEVTSLLSGKEGLTYLNNNSDRPKLVLLDLNMPVMNGWELLNELAKSNVEINIILVTSSDDPHDRKKAEQYPLVKDYLVKPLSKENLGALFSKHLKM